MLAASARYRFSCCFSATAIALNISAISSKPSSTAVFGELDWVLGSMQQAEDRCHRIGQNDCVLVQVIVLSGSVDAKIAKTLINKMEIIEMALDEPTPESEFVDPGDHVRVDKKQVDKLAPFVSEYVKEKVLSGLRALDTICDGARIDTNIRSIV